MLFQGRNELLGICDMDTVITTAREGMTRYLSHGMVFPIENPSIKASINMKFLFLNNLIISIYNEDKTLHAGSKSKCIFLI